LTDIIDVKKKIQELLLADETIKSLVGSSIHIGWMERGQKFPCITITDPVEKGDVGELGGGVDEYDSVVQVDVWCKESSEKSGPLNRDELAKQVKVVLGKKTNFQAMQSAGFILSPPLIRSLDELDMKSPVYRKSLQFRVLYHTGSYAL